MFTALIVGEDPTTGHAVRDALVDAGCVHTDVRSLAEAAAASPDLVVVDLASCEVPAIAWFTERAPEVPVVAICEEAQLDAVVIAGAAESVIVPLRRNELVARIRHALRLRAQSLLRADRDRETTEQIATLQRENHDLQRLACVDSLTGIANRRHGLALLEAEWRRCTREHLPLGLVMIDLDCYHAYNEQYGHLGGDACLQRVAAAMVRCLRRPSDYLGRYGGEEFLAVLPNTDAIGAKLVAERLRAAVEALAIPHAASVCARIVTITAGFASLRASAELAVERLIEVADAALLRAKAEGRNRVEGDAPIARFPARLAIAGG